MADFDMSFFCIMYKTSRCTTGGLEEALSLRTYSTIWYNSRRNKRRELSMSGGFTMMEVGSARIMNVTGLWYTFVQIYKIRWGISLKWNVSGLTLLLPYIIGTRRNWSACKLRVFALSNKKDELEFEQRRYVSNCLYFMWVSS